MGLGLSTDWAARRERAFSLPHPPVSVTVFRILEDAIVVAWGMLHTDPPRPFDPKTAKEKDFTTHLHEILENHLLDSSKVDGFTGEVFSSIKRPEVRNYDGKKTSKRPDMVAFLADRANVMRSQDGIFIECKPVDDAHSLLTDYCDAGIARFIVGDYAWAMTEALMVGYNTVHDKPSAALAKPFAIRANERPGLRQAARLQTQPARTPSRHYPAQPCLSAERQESAGYQTAAPLAGRSRCSLHSTTLSTCRAFPLDPFPSVGALPDGHSSLPASSLVLWPDVKLVGVGDFAFFVGLEFEQPGQDVFGVDLLEAARGWHIARRIGCLEDFA